MRNLPPCVLLLLLLLARPCQADTRPNIVFFFADDQTTSTLGCYGNEVVQTPNIDALASREEVKLDVVLDVDSVNLKREVIISEQCFAIVPRGLFSEAIDSGQFDWAPIVSPSIDRVLCLASRANFSLETFARIESMLTPCIESYIKNGRVNWHLVA